MSPVRALDGAGARRPGRQHDHRDLEARGARRLDREQRVVDRPQRRGRRRSRAEARGRRRGRGPGSPGRAARAGRRRPRRRARRRRPPPRAARRSSSGSISSPASSGAEVGGGRRPVAVGRDLVVALGGARGPAQQLVVGLLAGPGSSRPVTAGLKTATCSPAVGQRPGDHRGDDGLADLGAGAGDEDPVHRSGGERRSSAAPAAADPGSRAAPPITPAAQRSSAARCVAITVRRRREEPSGTVGGRIPWAKTPRSRTRSQSSIVRPASPTPTGTIWVAESPAARPSAAQRGAQRRRVRAQPLDQFGRRLEQLEGGRRRRPTDGGGGAVEKMNGRAVLSRYSTVSAAAQT